MVYGQHVRLISTHAAFIYGVIRRTKFTKQTLILRES
jgi:hypothetical protein